MTEDEPLEIKLRDEPKAPEAKPEVKVPEEPPAPRPVVKARDESREPKTSKPPSDPGFHVLSDAELAQRSRMVTLVGLAVLFLVSSVTVGLMMRHDDSPAKAGPLHVVTTGSTHHGGTNPVTPEEAPTPVAAAVPTPANQGRKPVSDSHPIPAGKPMIVHGKTVYEW